MKQNYISLELDGIMGMGAVGPTIAMLTATLYSAVASSIDKPPHWVYPVIMLVLSGLLAVFPTVKAKFSKPLRCALWPIATTVVFAAAWGVNHGLSVGEEALNGCDQTHVEWSFPSLVPSAYAQDTNDSVKLIGTNAANWKILSVSNTWVKTYTKTNHPAFVPGTKVNEVDFTVIDSKTKVKVPASFKKLAPKDVWGFTTKNGLMYLKGRDGEWYGYRPKVKKSVTVKPPPKQERPMQQQQIKGGFFKRY